METKNYTVMSPIRHGGKEYGIGATVDLNAKQAEGFGDCVELTSSAAAKKLAANTDAAHLVDRISALLAANKELKAELLKHEEKLATLNDEHAEAVASLNKQIDELTTQRVELFNDIDSLKAENEQLKAAAAAKPAAKGAK